MVGGPDGGHMDWDAGNLLPGVETVSFGHKRSNWLSIFHVWSLLVKLIISDQVWLHSGGTDQNFLKLGNVPQPPNKENKKVSTRSATSGG